MLRQIVVCGAVLALTAGGGAMAATPANAPASTASMEHAEIAGVQSVKVTPQEAIKAAEAKVPGHAVSFGYEKTATVNAYQVVMATTNGLETVQIDPQTGAVIGTIPTKPDALAVDGLPQQDISHAKQAKVTLSQAVRSAEQQGQGRALEAGYAMRNGQLAIDVDVARNGAIQAFTVNPQSGHVAQSSSMKG